MQALSLWVDVDAGCVSGVINQFACKILRCWSVAFTDTICNSNYAYLVNMCVISGYAEYADDACVYIYQDL